MASLPLRGQSRSVARLEAGCSDDDTDCRSACTDGSTNDTSTSEESDGASSGDEQGQCMDETREKFEMRFETIFREEKLAIEARKLARSDYGSSGVPFSVAFSGGGVRAASFQAGVLWRLAASGRLKDVEYLCAVSGGGYIASGFASHCLEAAPPRPGEALESWYLDRVAETICRMQSNIGYLVRDIAPIPGSERHTEGSGMFPRAFDLPILVGVIIATLMTFPITFTFMYLIPFAEMVDLFFGSAARMAFCAHGISPWQIFLGSYHMRMLVGMAGIVILTNFVIFVLWKTLPACRLRQPAKPGGRPPRNVGWLLGQSSLAALTRLCALLVLCLAVVMVLTDMEIWEWDYDVDRKVQRAKVCSEYVELRREDERWVCSDLENGTLWWDTRAFDAVAANEVVVARGRIPSGFVREALYRFRTNIFKHVASMWKVTLTCFGVMLAISLILLPCVDFLLIWVLFLLGPVCLFMVTAGFVRWRVFSPITKQGMPPVTEAPFNLEDWGGVVFWTFIIDIALVPIYQFLRANMHRYYARSLQRAYFAKGIDKTWKQLKDNLFCPFLVLTGTVNDYVRVDSDRTIHEISFSFLHTGSDTLGYVRCRRPQSLAKCTALTGAATDAFILGMLDRFRYRFWLEVLNLAMGDFIPFRRRERPIVRTVKRKLGLPQNLASQFVYKLPSCLLIMVCYVLFLRALVANQRGEGYCHEMSLMARAALAVGMTSFVLSFFGFLPCFKFLLHQPGIRQLHQAMRYYHRAARPPNLIYVTDGGVQDCTGILQLIRRRRSRILLALAGADPTDELGVFRTTMEDAARQKLASFYDPVDPRRDVRVTLDEFQRDQEKPYLHLGVHFGWGDAGPQETGHLVIVKNRLPPSMAQEPVRPLLTEEDIKHPAEIDHDVVGDLRQADLGACCCDCCHFHGLNIASKFPHVSNANQCMTPQMFNSLCRLGFALSEEAVGLISQPGPLDESWEKGVPQRAPQRRRDPPPPQASMAAARRPAP